MGRNVSGTPSKETKWSLRWGAYQSPGIFLASQQSFISSASSCPDEESADVPSIRFKWVFFTLSLRLKRYPYRPAVVSVPMLLVGLPVKDARRFDRFAERRHGQLVPGATLVAILTQQAWGA